MTLTRINLISPRKQSSKELLNRLIENQYEVTDTFSYYLSLRKPDHNTGTHFYIPPSGFKSNSVSLAKLQKVICHMNDSHNIQMNLLL